MATHGMGKCPRCGTPHKRLLTRGPCRDCLRKERERRVVDTIATPEKLRGHPDLDEVDSHLDEHYSV